jgi:hypothetical protein
LKGTFPSYASIGRISRHTPSGTTPFTAAVNDCVTGDLLGFKPVDGDGPRFGAMIGLVAVVVAAVILVFFGIGYALGRLFL